MRLCHLQKRMKLEIITLDEINQSQKDKYCMFSHKSNLYLLKQYNRHVKVAAFKMVGVVVRRNG
jgi:AAA15 family ATPase/GTPase